jgi:ubiquinone/menaquinone biosynthesis C-methylase UbiE
MHEPKVIAKFTQQGESFNSAAVARAADVDGLVRLAAPQPHQRWLDVACRPGIVTRRLAAQVREVHGVDVTPAMVALARREAAAVGLSNVSFAVADATALDVDTASADGVVARFAIALAGRPEAAECFRVIEDEDRGRILRLRVWMARWRR